MRLAELDDVAPGRSHLKDGCLAMPSALISANALLGQVGLEWQLGGFAAVAPTASMGSSDGSTSQLVQAMAGFGGSGIDANLTTVPLAAEASPQTVLSPPQHA